MSAFSSRVRLAMVCCALMPLLGCNCAADAGTGGGTGGGDAESSDDGGTSGAGGGPANTGGGSASAGGGASSAGGGASSNATKEGVIVLAQLPVAAPTFTFLSGTAVVGFQTIHWDEFPGCISTAVNNCLFQRCDVSKRDAGTNPVTGESAGVITITGTKQSISLSVESDGGYTPLSKMPQLWDGGEVLSVSASGGTVPAFSDKSIVAPSILTQTAPVCAIDTCPAFDRLTPLAVAWAGGPHGTVYVDLTTLRPGGEVQNVQCWFKASDGRGTIGTDMLANLSSTTDGGTGVLAVWNQSSTSFDSGAFRVQFIATENVTRAQLEVR